MLSDLDEIVVKLDDVMQVEHPNEELSHCIANSISADFRSSILRKRSAQHTEICDKEVEKQTQPQPQSQNENKNKSSKIRTSKKRSLKDRAKELEEMKINLANQASSSDSSDSDSSSESEDRNKSKGNKKDQKTSNTSKQTIIQNSTINQNVDVFSTAGHIKFDNKGTAKANNSSTKKAYLNQFDLIPKTKLSEHQKSEIINTHLSKSVPERKPLVKAVKITPDTIPFVKKSQLKPSKPQFQNVKSTQNFSKHTPNQYLDPWINLFDPDLVYPPKKTPRRNSYGNQVFTAASKPSNPEPSEPGYFSLTNSKNESILFNQSDFTQLQQSELNEKVYNKDWIINGVVLDEVKMRPNQTGQFVGKITSIDGQTVTVKIRDDFVAKVKGEQAQDDSEDEFEDQIVFEPNWIHEIYTKKEVAQELKSANPEIADNTPQKIVQEVAKESNVIFTPGKQPEQSEDKEVIIKKFLESKRRTQIKTIKRQMEYYFGNKNYESDAFLQTEVKKNPNRYISLDTILTFNKMKHLNASKSLIIESLKGSTICEVSPDQSGVRKIAN